jgi:hypothetical protein
MGGPASASTQAHELRFKLVEMGGLRRFGYPVHTILPGVRAGNHFRLTRGDRVIPAQFRAVDGPDGGPAIALDFNASPGPLETEDYIITYGAEVEPAPEPKPGMRVEKQGDLFRVWNGSSLEFQVPADLNGFLKSVRNARLPFLAEHSDGLRILCKDAAQSRIGAKPQAERNTRATVVREGPLAVSLRFESVEALPGDRSVKSTATLTFPSSKSWVETTWTVDDPEGWVAGLGLDLNFTIEGEPTLVDLGATDTVYGQLKGSERLELRAGEAPGRPTDGGRWSVLKGQPERLQPFAVPPSGVTAAAEGWAHVMDRSRCTALALAAFGRQSRDRIEVNAGGRVSLARQFAGQGTAPAAGPKSMHFWFHFVTNPVQVGAATSPQAMLAPLRVVWEQDRHD